MIHFLAHLTRLSKKIVLVERKACLLDPTGIFLSELNKIFSVPIFLCSWVMFQDESMLIWFSGKEEKQLKLSNVSRIIPGQRTVSFYKSQPVTYLLFFCFPLS